MCTSSSMSIPCTFATNTSTDPISYGLHYKWPLKRHNLRIQRLIRGKKLLKNDKEMEMKNMRLYMENQDIIKENERLRKKALLLHQENQILLSQLQSRKIN